MERRSTTPECITQDLIGSRFGIDKKRSIKNSGNSIPFRRKIKRSNKSKINQQQHNVHVSGCSPPTSIPTHIPTPTPTSFPYLHQQNNMHSQGATIHHQPTLPPQQLWFTINLYKANGFPLPPTTNRYSTSNKPRILYFKASENYDKSKKFFSKATFLITITNINNMDMHMDTSNKLGCQSSNNNIWINCNNNWTQKNNYKSNSIISQAISNFKKKGIKIKIESEHVQGHNNNINQNKNKIKNKNKTKDKKDKKDKNANNNKEIGMDNNNSNSINEYDCKKDLEYKFESQQDWFYIIGHIKPLRNELFLNIFIDDNEYNHNKQRNKQDGNADKNKDKNKDGNNNEFGDSITKFVRHFGLDFFDFANNIELLYYGIKAELLTTTKQGQHFDQVLHNLASHELKIVKAVVNMHINLMKMPKKWKGTTNEIQLK